MKAAASFCVGLVLVGCRSEPKIEALTPPIAPGGRAFVLTVDSAGEFEDVAITIDGRRHEVRRVNGAYVAEAGPLPRGRHDVRLVTERGESAPASLNVGNTPATLAVQRQHLASGGSVVRISWETKDYDGDAVEVAATGHHVRRVRRVAPNSIDVETSTGADHLEKVELIANDGHDQTRATIEIDVRTELPAPTVRSVPPIPGGRPILARFEALNVSAGSVLEYDGVKVPTTVHGRSVFSAQLPSRKRGRYLAILVHPRAQSSTIAIDVSNAPPTVHSAAVTVDEGQTIEVPIRAEDMDGDDVTVSAIDLPPGARVVGDEVVFAPDFIQSGAYVATLIADDGALTSTATLRIDVLDAVRPPMPHIVERTAHEDHERIVLAQSTDTFLDRADRAGRTFEATLVAPSTTDKLPLRVYLHGFGGKPFRGGRGDQFCVYPFDSDRTYWWGYLDENGKLTPYTARRVLHLVEYVLKTYPNADPNRVYLFGTSMGGAGAATIGAKYARHFAYVEATMGQMIPRLHRPTRIEQLTTHWGPPSNDWDDIDVVRLLVQSAEARDLFFHTRHAKDDPIIHFGATLFRSPLVKVSYYEAIQRERIGHYAAWDEGGHGPPDPELGTNWWLDDWAPALDGTTTLARNLAFVAFTNAAHDDDPGLAQGDGRRPYDPDKGYAGELEVVGDQGWGGDRAGTFNRHLRWNTPTMVDEWHQFAVELRSKKKTTADVTPRRTQRFRPRAGEKVRWKYGDQMGTATADRDGAVTVAALPIGPEWMALYLERDAPPLPNEDVTARRRP